MARGKKKENELTIEERLEQALVPVEEQPYEVPENWCFFHFTSLIDIEGGTQPPKSQFIDTYKAGYIRLVQIRDFATDKYIVYVPDNKKMRHFNEEDILIARYGASLGRICTGLSGVYNVALAKTIFSEETLYRKYVYWMLQSWAFQKPLLRISRTAQAGFNKNDLAVFKMPLPPLAEQQRIVDRIESLFAKLDEAKEKAQAVVDGFEARKAAILHKAFIGELTAKWREENNIMLDSWQKSTLESVCSSIFDGDHLPPPKSNEGIPFLVISNVNTGHLSYENTRFVPESYYNLLSETRKPEVGDLLYTLVGSYGIPVVVDDKRPFCFQRHMALLKLKEIDTYFMWYLLQSQEMYSKATSIATGTAQLTVPIKGLRKIEFMRPSDNEQKEIVRLLNFIFVKEQQAKETAEAVLDQIETMKKSILARAFRGELGTNDPTEESAGELLKKHILLK